MVWREENAENEHVCEINIRKGIEDYMILWRHIVSMEGAGEQLLMQEVNRQNIGVSVWAGCCEVIQESHIMKFHTALKTVLLI